MKLLAILAADNCIHARDGKFSVIGIYRKIYADQFPAVHPKMCLYASFEVERDDPGKTHVVRVEFEQPEGAVMFAIDGEIEVLTAYQVSMEPQLEFSWEVPPLTLKTMGPYTLRVILDGALVGERVIEVILVKAQG